MKNISTFILIAIGIAVIWHFFFRKEKKNKPLTGSSPGSAGYTGESFIKYS